MNKFSAFLLASTFLSSVSALGQTQVPSGPISTGIAPGTPLSTGTVTATGGNTARTTADRGIDPGFSVLEKGAKCDGTTDDTSAINSALSSGATDVYIPYGKICYSASGITVPPGVNFSGRSFIPSNPPSGSEVLCAAAVTSCVTLGNGVNNLSSRLSDMIVATNATVTPTANAVYVNGGYNVTVERVMAYNAANGFYWKGTATLGLSGKMREDYTGIIANAHIVQDTWAELRIEDGRYGMNGAGDLSANYFIEITGGVAATQAGPNTLTVVNSQFNQGSGNKVAYLLGFVACGASPCINGLSGITGDEFTLIGTHVETVGTAFVYSDNTWNYLPDLMIVGNTMTGNATTQPFFALDAGTQLSNAAIVGNYLSVSDMTLNGAQINNSSISSNTIFGNVNFSPASGASSLSFSSNQIVGNLTFGGAWNSLSATGGGILSGTLTNTATGSVNITIPGQAASLNAGTSTSPTLTLKNTGANGSQIRLSGNGGTTPDKYLRVLSGIFQIINSANSQSLLNIQDNGTINSINGAIIAGNTKFTTSGCSVSATTGQATAGTYTSGTAGTCTVVITMNGASGMTAPNGWNCSATDWTTPADTQAQTATTQTTATISGTTASGDVVHFACQPY